MSRKSAVTACALLLAAVAAAASAQDASAPRAPQPAPRADPAGEELAISAQNGQTQEQLWADRYACDAWSKNQSGFDPARPASGAAPGVVAALREQYRRALTACLEARGYGVRYAAPAPAAAAPLPQSRAPVAGYDMAQATGLRYRPLTAQFNAGYTLTEGAVKRALENGSAIGLGLAWFPSSALPIGLRLDASYSRFEETLQSRAAVAHATGANVAFGHQDLYGGDADLQLDLAHGGSRAKMYLFGGAGWYRQETVFRQLSFVNGVVCYFACYAGYFPVVSTVQRTTSSWLKAWNAGAGIEFALAYPATFFLEARYLRVSPYGADQVFIPIRFGLRF